MWVAKLVYDRPGNLILPRTRKYGLSMLAYPLSYFPKGDVIIVQFAATLHGAPENIKKCIAELKTATGIKYLEVNGNFLVGVVEEPIHMAPFYNPDIIHLQPAIFPKQGLLTVYVGSFRRSTLSNVITKLKSAGIKVLYFGEQDVKNISIMRVNPELTIKQQLALDLALEYGY